MDTLQVATGFISTFWKFWLLGLAGFGLHLLKEVKDNRIGESTWKVYFDAQKWEILWGLASYVILVWLWKDGTIFSLLSYVGLSSPKIELNAGTFVLGFFSSSIMTAFTTLWQYAGDRVRKVFEKKIDSMGETKQPPS